MIPNYKKVLYATDISESSPQVFRHAIALARSFQARISVIHVLPEIDSTTQIHIATEVGKEKLEELKKMNKKETEETLRQRVRSIIEEELVKLNESSDFVECVEILQGGPVDVILDEADRIGVDLIILGSHEKGPLGQVFLGSVADKVLRKSHRPVLIIPIK